MRRNEPVTGREHPFPEGESLVSVTDAKGRITYCNPAFIALSGYAREELLGQPHNIVRHPDMPAEAFRDLWATIQSGQPWTGLVKNRRKDGDHYWVRANATPMRDGERIVGYLSVRTQPGRDEVRAAEQLYARLNQQAQGRHPRIGLRQGQVCQLGWRARLAALHRPDPRLLLGLLLAALGLGESLAAERFGAFSPGALLLLAAAVALALGLVQRRIYRPLGDKLRAANSLAACDLSHPPEGHAGGLIGHLARAMQQLGLNLRAVVGDTHGGLERLNHAFHEIASSNQDLSARTETQASSLQQTAASMEQIQSTVRRSTQIASEGHQLAQQAAVVTLRSQQAVNSVADSVEAIADSSRQIAAILEVVEGVAFQTNVLALNAAVEAARAGEQGRGFAVVAGEVRALAQRSSDAAREVRALIARSNQQLTGGALRATEARERMQEAVGAVARVADSLQAIRAAATEQQTGIAQVNAAIHQLDGLTQQNAAMVEQLAAAAMALETEVDAVNQSMRMFRLQQGEATVAEVDAVALRRAGPRQD